VFLVHGQKADRLYNKSQSQISLTGGLYVDLRHPGSESLVQPSFRLTHAIFNPYSPAGMVTHASIKIFVTTPTKSLRILPLSLTLQVTRIAANA